MKNKKEIFILVIIVLAVVISIFRIYNIYMFKKILNEISIAIVDLLNNSNFTYEVNSSSEELPNYKKWIYNKEKVALQKNNGIYYGNLKTNELYVANLEDNTYTILDASILPQIKPEIFINAPIFYSVSQISNLQLLLFTSVKKDKIENVECYKVKISGEGEAWINKETLMPIKYIRDNVEYIFTINQNNVTEADVTFNDIDNFTKVN